jgi:hypothetical protein
LCTEEEKAPFEAEAAADKGRYKEALAKYEKNKRQEAAPASEGEESDGGGSDSD